MMIRPYEGHVPSLHPACFVAENAALVGDVVLAEGVSVWYGAVLRGDEAPIRIGAGTNLQDNAVLHGDLNHPLIVGENITVGHGAILHGCTIEDNCLIGMGAILLNGCVIGADSVVSAGALVTQNKVIPPRSMVMGSPAKIVRTVTDMEAGAIAHSASDYRRVAALQLPRASEEDTE